MSEAGGLKGKKLEELSDALISCLLDIFQLSDIWNSIRCLMGLNSLSDFGRAGIRYRRKGEPH